MSLFRAVVLSALFGLALGEGYWNIQLSPQSNASVPYGSGHIAIWQHATDKTRYYAMPLVYLLNRSSRVATNTVTGVTEMSFDVLLWSEEAREAVYLYLKREFDYPINKNQIELLPMEKVRIVWKDNLRPIASEFRIIDNWKTNTHLPSLVTFHFTCDNRRACEDLMNAMKESPHFFDGIEMEYVINGQRSARRDLTVTGKNVMQGRLWTKMTMMTGAGNTRYLTADDLKTLTSDAVSNVLSSLVTDSDYVDTGDEVRLADVLEHVLSRQEVSTANFQPHQWNSVFWDSTWTRPDKLTNYLNRVLEKDTLNSSNFHLNEHATEGGGDVSFMSYFSILGSDGSRSISSPTVKKEDVLNALRERHANVEWTGEQFRVKPMKLYRLNLSTLNTSNIVATANVQVRRYESVHAIKLRVATASTPQTPILTPQLVESRLLQKINETNSNITEQTDKLKTQNTRLANMLQTQNTRLTNMLQTQNTRLTNMLQTQNTRLTNMLQTQNTRSTNMLQTQNTRLKNTINANHNQAIARFRPIESKFNQLNSNGWPVGPYCILSSDGSCPSGFSNPYFAFKFKPWTHVTNWKRTFGASYVEGIENGDWLKFYFDACCRSN